MSYPLQTIMKSILLGLLLLASTAQSAVVLQYHHVDARTPAITSTSPEAFIQHLDFIQESGREVVSLDEIVAQPEIENDRRVAITFDDAYDNLLTNAVPELVRREWPFTIFVATAYVGRPGYLSWDDLRAIESKGGTLANHTHTHLHMLRLQEDETAEEWLSRLEKEIVKAQTLLEKHLQRPTRHFAYPYGEYNQEILELIADLKFVGFGQQSGAVGNLSDPRLLPRYPLSGVYANFDPFKVKLLTRALPIENLQVPPQSTENPPSLRLHFPEIENLRLNALTCYGPGGITDLEKIDDKTFVATNKIPVPVGRSRYNCTMPVTDSSEYYWFSQLWIRKRDDGTWYPE